MSRLYRMEIIDIVPSTLESNTSIQHQEVDLAQIHLDLCSKITPFFDLADIYGIRLRTAVLEGSVGLG